MNTRKKIGVIAFFLLSNVLISQEFDRTTHDFGIIREEDGKVNTTFTFTNTNNTPLQIVEVHASCGCTIAEWPKVEINNGESGTLKIIYNPINRPGDFRKSISVQFKEQEQKKNLLIIGKVIPREKEIEDMYPYSIGNLRFSTLNLYFGDILHDSKDTSSIIVYNESINPIELKIESSIYSQHTTINVSNSMVSPGQTERVFITYDVSKKDSWGYVEDNITIQTNDSDTPKKRLKLIATIKENFKYSIEESSISFNKKVHDFGLVDKKHIIEDFLYYNK